MSSMDIFKSVTSPSDVFEAILATFKSVTSPSVKTDVFESIDAMDMSCCSASCCGGARSCSGDAIGFQFFTGRFSSSDPKICRLCSVLGGVTISGTDGSSQEAACFSAGGDCAVVSLFDGST